MKYGVFFPNAPLSDLVKARDLAQDFEGAGFDYFCLGGHVLMSRPGRYAGFPEWVYATPFTDPFGMFGDLARFTSRIHMMTSISILPAMSTALVARQAVELAFVSGDRFELGVGLSWQEVEFRGFGYYFLIPG